MHSPKKKKKKRYKNHLPVSCCCVRVSWHERRFLCRGRFCHHRKPGWKIKRVSLWERGQVAVITVKEVPQKECCPPHSHLHYLSTCQSICRFATRRSEDWQTPFTRKHVSHAMCGEDERHLNCRAAKFAALTSRFLFQSWVSNYDSCAGNKAFYQKLSRRQSANWQLTQAAITFVSHFD